MMWHQRADVVVVGTGVAGLVAALAAHRRGRKVIVLSKAADTATFYAQGGIAVVLPDTDDSIDAHVADTVAAGAADMTDDDLAELRGLGLDDAEILDVVLAAAARCFFSTVLDATGAQPDAAYGSVAPGLRDALTVGRPIATA